jgi:putative peptidoglycan lipid II flippase
MTTQDRDGLRPAPADEPSAAQPPPGGTAAQPAQGGATADAEPGAAAGDSISVATWTIVSRLTGVLRIGAIGAVLGPTFFGNTYQFTNSLPNIVYYGFLAGSLFSSLLVPALIQKADLGGRRGSERIAGGFLGMTILTLAAVAPLAILGAPVLLGLSGGGEAVGDGRQVGLARLLIVLLMPQVFCYAVVGTSAAVMNSRRRFALAAAAPAVENLGTLAVLGATAVIYGASAALDAVPAGEVLLLGAGTTAAVALHACLQWWGARRAGVELRPRAGWRDPEVRVIVRRALPSLAQTGLLGLQWLATLTIANRLAGGVVAYQIAMTFFQLPLAVATTPVALSVLPRLSRLHLLEERRLFRDTLTSGYALALFATIPAATGYLVLAEPLAQAISVGRMNSGHGAQLIAASLAVGAAGIVGQTVFMIATYACYARKDTRSPLRSMALQAGVCLSLLGAALGVHGTAILAVVGAAYSLSSIASAVHLHVRLRRRLAAGIVPLAPSLLRICLGAAVMAGPVWLLSRLVGAAGYGRAGSLLGLSAAIVVGVGVFVATQAVAKAPELTWLIGGVSAKLRGRA